MGQLRDAMEREMALRKYADRTRRIYVHWMVRLAKHHRRSPSELTAAEVRAFFVSLADPARSTTRFNQALAAARLLYVRVLKRPDLVEGLEYQPCPVRVAVVLSASEVRRILDAAVVLRDRAILETAYGTGLRLNEVLHLRLEDIDSGRMAIHVLRGKGQKDRYVSLPQTLLKTLRAYWKESRPRLWLFPGKDPRRALHSTTAERAFHQACRRAGVTKAVSFHTLRHSYATHLVEGGANVRNLQELLGHRSLQTTQRYAHISADYLSRTTSPLDLLSRAKPAR